MNVNSLVNLTYNLLNDCKTFGTIPFSAIARIAFMGSILLKSLETNGVITTKEKELLLNSIETPLSQIQNDIERLSNSRISKTLFLKKYGHLRPGTYDITAPRYDQNKKFFAELEFLKKTNSKRNVKINIQKFLSENPLKLDQEELLSFIKKSISLREKLKFEFTKNLSDGLEIIALIGKRLDFSREEISYLSINDIMKIKNLRQSEMKKILKKKIETEKTKFKINSKILLPPIISEKKNFEIIEFYKSKPNFVTEKIVSGDLILLNNFTKMRNFSKKIVMIENADPGFDWVFSRNPLGLITKYGGTASHMAIRCSEMALPAAIGCGEIIFENLIHALKVKLDCKNKDILIQNNKEYVHELEVKKVLKSLGYIK